MSVQVVTSDDPAEENKTLRFIHVKSFEDGVSEQDSVQNNSLEVSNRYGVTFIVYNGQLRVTESKSLLLNDRLPAVVRTNVSLIALSCDETLLAIAQGTQVLIFETRAFCQQPAGAQPRCTFVVSKVGKPTAQLAWNPSDVKLIAALSEDGTLIMIRILDNWSIEAATTNDAGFRCMSWSPKGKQLVVAGLSGIIQLKLDLKEAKRVPVPPNLAPVSIYWLSTLQFLIVFQSSSNDDIKIVLLTLSKTGPPLYKDYGDIFLSDDYTNARVISKHIPQWKVHLLCTSTSSDVISITHDPSQPTSNVVVQELDDRYRPALPLENYCRGAGIYFGYDQPLEINGNELRGTPALFLLSQKGLVSVFQILNDGAESIHMPTPEPVAVPVTTAATASVMPMQPAASLAAPTATFTAPAAVTPAFGNLNLPTPDPSKIMFGAPNAGNLFGTPTSISFGTPKPATPIAPIASSTPVSVAAIRPNLFATPVTSTTVAPAAPLGFNFGQLKPVEIKAEFKPEEKKVPAFAPPAQLGGAGDAASIVPKDMGGVLNKQIQEIKTDIKKYDYKHLQEQIRQFELRYAKLRKLHAEKFKDHNDAVQQYFTQLDAEILKDLNKMSEFAKDIAETTKGQKEEVEALFVNMQNLFNKVEYARIAAEKNMDSKYLRLLRAQPIDPQSLAKFTKVEKLYTYLKNQVKESRRHYTNSRPIDKPFSVETIYQTLSCHEAIIRNLSRVSNDLRQRLSEQQLGRMASLSKTNITLDDLASGVSSLKLRPRKEDEAKVFLEYSKEKVEHLKRWAGKTLITRVPVTGAIDPYTPITQIRKIRLNPESAEETATDSTTQQISAAVKPTTGTFSVSTSVRPSSVGLVGSGPTSVVKPIGGAVGPKSTTEPAVVKPGGAPPAFSFSLGTSSGGLFGSTTSTISSGFGSTPTTSAPLFGSTAAVSTAAPSFASTLPAATSAPYFGSTATALSTTTPAFGSVATSASLFSSAFGAKPPTTSAPLFGSLGPTTTSSILGATSTASVSSAPLFGSSLFGSSTATAKPAFSFTASTSAAATTSTAPVFGALKPTTTAATSTLDTSKTTAVSPAPFGFPSVASMGTTIKAEPAEKPVVPKAGETAESTTITATVAPTQEVPSSPAVTTTGLFGNVVSSQATPLFGTGGTSLFGTPKVGAGFGTSVPSFGTTAATTAAPMFSAATTATTAAISTTIAATSAPVKTTASSLFGSAPLFGTASAGSLFGSSAPLFGSTGSSTAVSSTFGGSVTPSSLTTSAATTPKSSPAISEALSATEIPAVTTAATITAPTGFGSTSSAPLFGSTSSQPLFAAPKTTTAGLFGTPTTASQSIGTTTSSSIFDSSSSPSIFGTKSITTSSVGLFGAPNVTVTSGSIFGGAPATAVAPKTEAAAAATVPPATTVLPAATITPTTGGLFGSISATIPSATTATTEATASPVTPVSESTPTTTPDTTTGSLFGSLSLSAASTPISPFGAVAASPAKNTSSIFGGATVTPVATSIFGSPAATTSAPGFGTPTTSPSVFGTPTTSAGAFGTPVAAATAAATPSLFGTPSASAVPTTPSVFGTPGGGSIFGSPATTGSGGSGSSLFGTPAAATGPIFGTPTTSSTTAFGSPSVFGGTATTTSAGGFGSAAFGSSPFGGGAQTTSSGGMFGSPSFGSSGGGLVKPAAFGTSAAQASVFGGLATTTASAAFGAASAPAFGGGAVFGGSPAFGSALKPSAFGSSSIFGGGSTSGASSFGGLAAASPTQGQSAFGTTTSTFASTQQSAFGSQTAFGSPSTQPFGSQPAGGQSAFGSPAFGSTGSGGGGFGQAASFGGGAVFGGSPAFGSAVSSPSGVFGGTPAATGSVFGSGSTVVSSSSFGGIAQSQPVFGAQSPVATGFGQQAQQQQPQPSFSSFGSFGVQQNPQQQQPQQPSPFGGGASFGGAGGFGQPPQAQQQAKPEFKGNSFSSWR